ncbi:unnamed protein product [Rotaria sp. Silwood1]|nr:unnamed protein product [Rotaria sp. Silwood1]CAF1125024.1 unnamed protein product [Rotaria sp. Silwood1]CAF1306890.1 unnamed protein product [Rotaria sp. Silwood1]CAF3438348.1 unnamed protein product [Rotaria sp. Silwood1]CAF3546189.1 unnamed protein product [Rotaria sp. Silwood1]
MKHNDEYTYEIIENETDALICAQLISEEFVRHNPIVVYDQVSAEEFFNERSWPFMMDVFDERLSFLARHRHSNEIVGAITAGDLFVHNQNHPYDEFGIPSTIPHHDLLADMANQFINNDFNQQLEPCLVLHIGVGATRAQHSRKGVASRLRRLLCNYARDIKGFQYAFVQVTNPITKHIYTNKLNAQIVRIIDPTRWAWTKKNCQLYPYKDYKNEPLYNVLLELTKTDKL